MNIHEFMASFFDWIVAIDSNTMGAHIGQDRINVPEHLRSTPVVSVAYALVTYVVFGIQLFVIFSFSLHIS